jgi:hypothetical protein
LSERPVIISDHDITASAICMRHLLASVLIFGLAVTNAQADASGAPAAAAVAPNGGVSPSPGPLVAAPAAGTTNAPVSPARAPENALDLICRTIETAASSNGLPLEFLTRLIWQESRFDTHAISRAGAQGIAQFMPNTAQWVGLSDPFDAADAINKSAALLRNLRQQFGNLGLAAAAYNAGPKRVSDWLTRKRVLPHETLAYVRIVTGHQAAEWSIPTTNSETAAADLLLPNSVPCPEIVKLFSEHRSTIAALPKLAPVLAVTASAAPKPFPWGVQLLGGPSELAALASFYQMQKAYRSVLGSHVPIVIRTPVGMNGSWYRVRVGMASRNEADRLCSDLRVAGGSCLIQPN